jgi:hypothetical protein
LQEFGSASHFAASEGCSIWKMQAEQKKRAKAIKAATKINKPLFNEDGKTRALLDKYDEEEEDTVMVLDEDGRAREDRRREEIRVKLAQGMLQGRWLLQRRKH